MLDVSNISSLFVHLASRAQQEEVRQARGMKSCYRNKSCSHTKSKHQGKDRIFKITAEVYRMWGGKKRHEDSLGFLLKSSRVSVSLFMQGVF